MNMPSLICFKILDDSMKFYFFLKTEKTPVAVLNMIAISKGTENNSPSADAIAFPKI